jgi:ubiquinone/menaquinone biosynthesis C-methylase UbiE
MPVNMTFRCNCTGFLGLRIEAYRSHAVDLLNLQQGDWVVELGSGTGLNFSRIMEKIGAEDRLTGLNFSRARLFFSSWGRM